MRLFAAIFFSCFYMLTAVKGASVNEQGNKAYEQGRFGEAISNYVSEVSSHPPSPAILHNLGLAYSQAGLHGKALFCFTKALELSPRDPRIRNSYKKEASLTDTAPLKPFSIGYWFSAPDVFWLNIVMVLIGSTIILVRLARRKSLLSGVALLPVSLWLLVLFAQLSTLLPAWNHGVVIVAVSETEARNGPFQEASLVKTLKDGQLLKIVAKHEGWLQFEDSQNATGWVRSAAVLDFAGSSGIRSLSNP